MADEPLYLWAIVPPMEIVAEIDAIRREFSEHFNCFKALKPPVHLTLYRPFRLGDAEMEAQLPAFQRMIGAHPGCRLVFQNFGFFDRRKSPVVFIDVIPDPELKSLNSVITHQTNKLFLLDDPGRQDFNPHFTIGYRDIPPDIFPEVKRAYSKRAFSTAFTVTHVTLFRHNGREWALKYELPWLRQWKNGTARDKPVRHSFFGAADLAWRRATCRNKPIWIRISQD